MPLLTHGTQRLNWQQTGAPSGRAVLFLNSLGTTLALWDAVVARLPADLRLIRMDTRGHGGSDAPEGAYDLDTLTADARALIETLGLNDVTVVGVSLGGVMAQSLALTLPTRVRAVVLSNTAPRMGTAESWTERMALVRDKGLEGIADAVMTRWFSPRFAGDIAPLRAMLCATPAQGYIGCCAALAGADLSARIAGITQPALVVAGRDDGASPPAQVRALADALPRATYVELADTGHLPMVERPDDFARHLTAFLADTGA